MKAPDQRALLSRALATPSTKPLTSRSLLSLWHLLPPSTLTYRLAASNSHAPAQEWYSPNLIVLTDHEPYRCTDQSRPRLLHTIDRTMRISRTASHGAVRTHFTVFPEYAIPAPEGIALVEDFLRRPDWPNQTIVIGGTDALSATDYATLAAGRSHTHRSSPPRSCRRSRRPLDQLRNHLDKTLRRCCRAMAPAEDMPRLAGTGRLQQ